MRLITKKLGNMLAIFLLFNLSTIASYAATPTLTGKCGATLNYIKRGVTLQDGVALSGIGLLDFDKKTAAGSISTYASQASKKSTLQVTSWTFEIKQGYFDGSALLVPNESNKPTIQILPVNEGKSYLLQDVDTDSIGVCQKI